MTSDMGEVFREMRQLKKAARDKYGVKCPVCVEKYPRANATILLPRQKCKVCGYRDPRPRTYETEYMHPTK